MRLLPRLVADVVVNSLIEVVAGLGEIELGDVVVGDLAGDHEAADLVLAHLLVLAVDGPGREADAGLVVGAGDEDGLAGVQQVVAVDVVGAAQGVLGHAVAEGEGGDGVVLVVEEVQRVLGGGGGGLFVVVRGAAAAAAVVWRRTVSIRRRRYRLWR